MPRCGRARHPGEVGHLPSAQRPAFEAKHVENLAGSLAQACADCLVEGVCSRQYEADRSTALGVDRVGEAEHPHVGEDASNALAEFTGNSKVGAHANDTGIAGIAADRQRFGRIGETRKAARVLDLNAIREDLDTNVVSGHGVRAMEHRVDESFEPDIPRNDRAWFESAATSECLHLRHPSFDHFCGLTDLLRD